MYMVYGTLHNTVSYCWKKNQWIEKLKMCATKGFHLNHNRAFYFVQIHFDMLLDFFFQLFFIIFITFLCKFFFFSDVWTVLCCSYSFVSCSSWMRSVMYSIWHFVRVLFIKWRCIGQTRAFSTIFFLSFQTKAISILYILNHFIYKLLMKKMPSLQCFFFFVFLFLHFLVTHSMKLPLFNWVI